MAKGAGVGPLPATAAAAPPPLAADGRFLEQLGQAAELVSSRRFREAEVEVLRALSIVPADLRAMKLLALVRFKLGHLEEARAVCREIAAALPRDAGLRLKLGLIALRLNRADEAILELELATRLAPDDARPWVYLAHAYARRGETARAAAAFRRAGREQHALQAESGALEAPVVSQPAPPSYGHRAAIPLHEFVAAHRLALAEQPLSAGGFIRLAVGADADVYVRRPAAVACLGAVGWTDAHRHVRGRSTDVPLGSGQGAFVNVRGAGEVCVSAPVGRALPLALNDEAFYVREERVLAFEGRLAWESGTLPRAGLRMLQFRGRGVVVLAAEQPLAVAVTPQRPAFVSPHAMLGWVGKVVAVGGNEAAAGPFAVACEGEGVVLMDAAPRSDKEGS